MKMIIKEETIEAVWAWRLFITGIIACVVGIMLIPDAPLSGRVAGSGMVLLVGAMVIALIGLIRD